MADPLDELLRMAELRSAQGDPAPSQLPPLSKPGETWSSRFRDYGATEPATLDVRHRPYVANGDGVSTVYSMNVNLDGKETLIPLVSLDGRIMSPDEAIDEYYRTGQHLGKYKNVRDAERAGEAIHQDQVRYPPLDLLGGKGLDPKWRPPQR